MSNNVAHTSKVFLTYERQIAKLKHEKGLIIDNEAYAIQLLKEHGYFGLISGYKAPFKAKDSKYKLHTHIEDIYKLYEFDNKLRALVLFNIMKVEKHIKSLISYFFCEQYGDHQSQYLDASHYNQNTEFEKEIQVLIKKLEQVGKNATSYPYIQHQKAKHGNIPLWVLLKALPLGVVSKMYSYLPQVLQIKVSKEFPFINESMFRKMLRNLSRVRNLCAHNERLFNYHDKAEIPTMGVHKHLNLPASSGKYKKGKDDLFATVIILKYLINEADFQVFIHALSDIITQLLQDNKTLNLNQLYKYMGFPENWKDIVACGK